MTKPVGTGGTIFNPAVWVNEDPDAPLPSIDLPLGTDMTAVDPGYRKFDDLADNITVDFANPQVAVESVDNGTLFFLPSGDDGISLTATTQQPTWTDALWSTGMREAVQVAKAQISVLTIGGTTASAGGNMLVNPGGITPVSIAIASSDTPAAAATKVAAGTYPGYAAAAVGAVVTFTAATAGTKGAPSVSGTPAGLTASFTTSTKGSPLVTAGILDKSHRNFFRLVIEGFAEEGGLFEEDQMVRFFGLRCTPAEEGGGGGGRGGGGRRGGGGGGGGGGRRGGGTAANPGSVVMGYAREGSHFQVALSVQFLPDPLAASVLTTAGYDVAVHDQDGRAVWYNHEMATV